MGYLLLALLGVGLASVGIFLLKRPDVAWEITRHRHQRRGLSAEHNPMWEATAARGHLLIATVGVLMVLLGSVGFFVDGARNRRAQLGASVRVDCTSEGVVLSNEGSEPVFYRLSRPAALARPPMSSLGDQRARYSAALALSRDDAAGPLSPGDRKLIATPLPERCPEDPLFANAAFFPNSEPAGSPCAGLQYHLALHQDARPTSPLLRSSWEWCPMASR
jgi:hypothetical protein